MFVVEENVAVARQLATGYKLLTLSFPEWKKCGVLKGGSNFWVGNQDAVVWPFKLNLFVNTFIWYYSFFQHLQNEIWKLGDFWLKSVLGKG